MSTKSQHSFSSVISVNPYKNSYLSLEFNRVKYYAILVGYEDDEYIVVKLYKEVSYTTFALEQKISQKFVYIHF